MSKETCARCGDQDYDRRTLAVRCFYALEETGIPFDKDGDDYTLRICKDCRADFMASMKAWFETVNRRESCGSGIFVREFGALVEMTDEEWRRRYGDREPVRLLKQ